MEPPAKHRIANIFIIVGVAPFLAWAGWFAQILSVTPHMHGGGWLFLLGITALCYAFAAVVAGPAMIWARVLRRRTPSGWTWLMRAPSVIGMMVLVVPLIFVAFLYVRYSFR